MSDRRPRIRRTFDREFFEQFYERDSSAVVSVEDMVLLVRFVLSYLDYLGVPTGSVLDAGCGTGLLQTALRRVRPTVGYTGIDPSPYLCSRYGWQKTSIARFKPGEQFDLIVCRDVMQYIQAAEVRESIDNLARLCRGALYFDVPTRDDFESGFLDEDRTDKRIYTRGARWYRRILDKHFIAAGGGLFIPRDTDTVVLALERT
jgi:SAM-dependent methyltransferase